MYSIGKHDGWMDPEREQKAHEDLRKAQREQRELARQMKEPRPTKNFTDRERKAIAYLYNTTKLRSEIIAEAFVIAPGTVTRIAREENLQRCQSN